MSGIALCYVRKSVVRTSADEVSPARQRAATVQEAERRGWVAELLEDAEGHQSGRTERRPGWIHLKSRLDDPLVKAVIVESLSRASRSVRDLFNFVHELEVRNITLISLKEQIDTTTAMGRAFLGVIAVLDEFESDVASERMKMTIAFKRETFKQHWGRLPFGTKREGAELKLVPTREGIWRIGQYVVVGDFNAAPFSPGQPAQWFGYHDALLKCYEIYSTADRGLVEIADRMNGLGYLYRDRNGIPRKFQKDDIRRMIAAQPIYAGNLPRGSSKVTPLEIIANTHSPILPLELCERVAAIHSERHSRWAHGGGGAPKRIYLLTNLHCGECASHLKGQYQHGIRYYRHSDQKMHCSQRMHFRADNLENEILARLKLFEAPEAMKARIREKARRLASQAVKPEWKNAKRLVAELNNKLERLKEMRIDGELDKAEYQRRKAKIEEQLQEAELRVRDAPPDVRTLEDLLPMVDQIAGVISQGDPARQRQVLSALFERTEVLDGKITKAKPRDWARPFFNGETKHQ